MDCRHIFNSDNQSQFVTANSNAALLIQTAMKINMGGLIYDKANKGMAQKPSYNALRCLRCTG